MGLGGLLVVSVEGSCDLEVGVVVTGVGNIDKPCVVLHPCVCGC